MRLFNWSAEQILSMPARRFFALLNEGRKQELQSQARAHVALCDIASIALGDAQYFEKVRQIFYDRAFGYEGKLRRALDPADPMTVQLVEALTMEASRVN